MLNDFVLAFYGLLALEPLAWSQPNYSIITGLTFGGVECPWKRFSQGTYFYVFSEYTVLGSLINVK